jgi:hypothetical protein
MLHSRPLVTLTLSFALVLAPAGTFAAGRTPKKDPAAELKRQGDRAMDALHYDDALSDYQRSYALSKDPALLYNQARAYQALGDYPAALEFLERFQAEAPSSLQARVPDFEGLDQDLRSKVSTFVLTCETPGAEVVLRDKVIGTTPLAPVRTTAGHGTLVVRADKYQPFSSEVDLLGGQTLTIDARLTPKDTSAVLVVHSGVVGAHVALDGTARGDVPLEIVTTAGLHTIRLERSGYEPTETSAVLTAASRKDIDVPMVKGTPLYARWWFWSVIGAAVAGGIATYFVATTEKGPDHGSISPGVISSGATATSLRF